jgi:Fe-S oxidoreductase
MNRIEELSGYRDDIYTCNRTRCGFCREECPVYKVNRYETFSCRGKMLMARGLVEGLISSSKEMAETLDRCLLCGYCQARCALKNMDVIMAMRQHMVQEGLPAQIHRENTNKILREGKLFETQKLIKRQGDTPFYVGCLYRSRGKELSTIFSVCERLDLHPWVGEEACCGYIVEATGFAHEFEEAQVRCKENMVAQGDKPLLTLCPTCTITLKERYGLPVHHAILAVHQKLKEPEMAKKIKPLDLCATYHDPCHLGRMLGIFEEPREILQQLGVEIIEMEHNRYFSTCCGGGGGLTMVDDALSIEISKNRLRDAIDVGVNTIVTVCPTCETVLGRGALRLLNETGEEIEVLSLWDLLDQSLQFGG